MTNAECRMTTQRGREGARARETGFSRRRALALSPRLFVAVILLLPMFSVGGRALAQSIVLPTEATVDTPTMTLGQVAHIGGADESSIQQVGKLVIGPSPAVGASAVVTMTALRDRLIELGVNRATWTLQGAGACRVTRVESAADSVDQLQAQSRKIHEGLSGPVVAMPEASIPDSLAGCIRKLLEDQYQPAGSKLTCQFDPSDRALLALARPQYRFELTVKRSSDHQVDVSVSVFANANKPASSAGESANQASPPIGAAADSPIKVANLRVQIGLTVPVVVTVRPLNRGQIIAPEDVQLVARPIGLGNPACRELAAVVGQEAKRVMKPDEIVQSADLTPQALVHRNKLVTVWSRRGGVLIKTIGRAMDDGVYGERILVRNEVSHDPFFGVVSGPDTVELDDTPVQQTRKIPGRSKAAPNGNPPVESAQPTEPPPPAGSLGSVEPVVPGEVSQAPPPQRAGQVIEAATNN